MIAANSQSLKNYMRRYAHLKKMRTWKNGEGSVISDWQRFAEMLDVTAQILIAQFTDSTLTKQI